ncbi:hypothetical protein [Ramlibacter sp.]|uniref:hypothetical protein n=1 Tax=Ramlibacter sp. TaxID=1917967 RepID=UPI0026337BFB|nr:hypothetical protein [Ramlibacter sp.]MDB5956012.1 hypothetical protein [Ramlibacter sp.]
MPPFASRGSLALLLAMLLAAAAPAQAEEPPEHLAPGFTARTAGSRLVVLPADMELFSMSAGGVIEPRADWTDAAQKNFVSALGTQGKRLGAQVTVLDAAQGDEFADIINLHRAVAEAINMHHRSGLMELATKGKALDWSLGDAVRPLKERTGADYALFTWMRDSYASNERKAAMLALAMVGALSLGGEQEGYASLVDLNTGRVLWFNRIDRMSGDLREPHPAVETVETLLKDFPGMQ